MKKAVKNTARTRRTRIPSHPLSRLARTLFERREVKVVVGFNLAAFTLFAAVLEPQAELTLSKQALSTTPTAQIQDVKVKTETTLVWPVADYTVSQGFHLGHPGIDITSSDHTIHPVDKGKVTSVQWSKWLAYGNHVIVEHPNGRVSLYAHLERIDVKKDDEVSRETVIGIMGQTGWATGVHLHLEIYQDGKALNPLEVLPANN